MNLTVLLNENNIQKAEAEIEQSYSNMIQLLNAEKIKLITTIKDLKTQK